MKAGGRSGRPAVPIRAACLHRMRGDHALQLLTLVPHVAQAMVLEELLDLSWQARQLSRPDCFEAVYPGSTLPVSVTGAACSLNCAHCGGKYLEHMVSVDVLEEALSEKNPASILLSGGCDPTGRVPLARIIDRVRCKLAHTRRPLKVNVHPGIVNRQEAELIADFATVISFDFIVDDETISEALGTSWTGRDYVDTFRNLGQGKAKVVPHILVGLYRGEIRGEYQAVECLAREGAGQIVFIVFIPTPGTRWEHLAPPQVEDVVRLLAWTRIRLPGAKLTLGCMRPRGKYRRALDLMAVRAGVDAIVLPHPDAVAEVRRRRLTICRKEECCAFD
jgi:uncharacterized radical SAM superfamily protein